MRRAILCATGIAIWAPACADAPDSSTSRRSVTAPLARTSAERVARNALADLRQLNQRELQRRLRELPQSEAELALRWFEERRVTPGNLELRYGARGTPRSIEGPGFRISAAALGLPANAGARRIADAFVERFAEIWKVEPSAFRAALVRETAHGETTGVEYRQLHAGLPVLGAVVSLLIDSRSAELIAVRGEFVPAGEIGTRPQISADAALSAAKASEREVSPRLAIHVGQRAAPRLVWVVDALDSDGALERVLVDATDAAIVERQPLSHGAMRRQHWDLRDRSDLFVSTCQRWQLSWPPAGCSASCAACTTDPRKCDSCACVAAGDPADCESAIWRYGEPSGCVPDGSPAGEGACSPEALTCWEHSKTAYDYWSGAFGRDSWDAAGGVVWTKSSWNVDWAAGMATRWDRDLDGMPELAWVNIKTGAANPWLLGHELGHVLQFGAVTDTGSSDSLYGTYGAAMESNADVHGDRYRGAALADTSCTGPDGTHYTELWTAPGTFYAQANKYIGNCQSWLMSQTSFSSWWHKGVTVTPTTPAAFDQIWYRALDAYTHSGDTYFEWWDHQVSAAFDLYGWSPPLFAAGNSTDAVGNWTPMEGLDTSPRPNERIAAVGWEGAPQGPCVFFRPSWDASRIMYQCRWGDTWFQQSPFNNPAVDPAASEPAAAYRYESGKIYAYVLWRGTDNRIHYRRFDLDDFEIGPPADLGPSHLTAGPVAAAGTWETAFVDRLVIVYHPLAQPTWLYATHLGSVDPPLDLGGSFDSDAPPAMAAYPYPSRVYVVRPDFSPSRHLAYRSYSVAAGWTPKRDLTALYAGDDGIDVNAVRSDRGVSLAQYGRSDPRLRMTFVTLPSGGARELWYATLSESAPGTLARERYRAVPLAAIDAFTSSAAGGLVEDKSGFPLWHFWGQGAIAGAPELHHWRMHGD